MNAPAGIDILAARAGVVEALFEDAYLSMFGENSAVCGVTGPAACRNNYVIIRHQDGSQARYAHMIHQGVFVDVGDVVRRGQLIGAVGSTGYSTGPHLHFDVWSPDAVLDIASGNTTLLPRWQARDPDNEEEGLYCYELPNAEGNSIDMRSTNERWP
jgi:murein DD-endopeptidase MepM/ murein hydrolase activator NlpD